MMSDLKTQILKELSALEDKIANLHGVAAISEKQTDLEVAILTKQVNKLREKNARALDFIDKSISIIKGLK